ncbi:hypothetical protein L3X38_041683 [Prunus dulcis]|uniref:TMV resistance protein N n=1 Tax=Prunus dulcis TaxID=3755 RepID=A0AAD4UT58_PRUDU|nr:hypothetical protein L3X38_041683 [Prunus dulcis]
MEISYKVEGLGDDEALELFSLNAFKKFEPKEGFWELSKCFVNYAGGVPLALKILGCFMYKRDRDEWKSELDKLRKIPQPTIFDLLKISYDRLDEMNQNIFLDVAFFHKGKSKEEVIEILDSCDRCGGINALIEKSLLTVEISNNIVGMHDLIQEMAFKIVRQESTEEPGGRSQLCHHNDIIHVLINNTGTNKIQGIALTLAELEKVDWNCEAFSKMINLKFLEVDNDLPNLKYMDLSCSRNLETIPNFTGIPQLQVLDLYGCENLVEIHPSVAYLKWLTRLILDEYSSIKSLPSEIEMDSLMYFSLHGCSKLKKIPEFSRQMENLSTLSLSGTAIEKLPLSIERLVGLTCLDVRNCKNLLGLPSAIRNLKSLKMLYAYGYNCPKNSSEIDPRSVGIIKVFGSSLEYLDLPGDSGLCDLPGDIGFLSSVQKLDLSRNNFVSIGCLPKHLNESCDDNVILGMLWIALDWRFLQVPALTGPLPRVNIVTPGRRIPEWFNNQSVGDSLIVELPSCTTWTWIALCAVFEDDHPNPPHEPSTNFHIECHSGKDILVRSSLMEGGHLVSPHLWVACVSPYVFNEECNQMKISFRTFYDNTSRASGKTYCSGIKKCGFRLVHEQDLEELKQIVMMNHSINISTKAISSHNSADARASSHQKSLCRKSYALSKGFLTKLVKIFSLFLTTAVFIKSFNNSKQWGA